MKGGSESWDIMEQFSHGEFKRCDEECEGGDDGDECGGCDGGEECEGSDGEECEE